MTRPREALTSAWVEAQTHVQSQSWVLPNVFSVGNVVKQLIWTRVINVQLNIYRRILLLESQTRTIEHVFQADGRALSSPPTIITTNLAFDEWHNFLGNKSMVDALLSRVRHYCHTVTINGPSLRDPQG